MRSRACHGCGPDGADRARSGQIGGAAPESSPVGDALTDSRCHRGVTQCVTPEVVPWKNDRRPTPTRASAQAQRGYTSLNYTHAAEAVEKMDVAPEIRMNAVRSLQFADMVEQLGAYCDGELDNVERLARDLNLIVNDVIDGSPGALGKLVEFQQALDARLVSLRTRLADHGHKSVVQQTMAEGDIELF